MKDIMDVAREVKSFDYEEAHKEIFELIKKDKTWLAEIVQNHVSEIIEDVLFVKKILPVSSGKNPDDAHNNCHEADEQAITQHLPKRITIHIPDYGRQLKTYEDKNKTV